MCIVAKRSPITATAEQLLNFDLPNITVQSIKLLSNKGPKAQAVNRAANRQI